METFHRRIKIIYAEKKKNLAPFDVNIVTYQDLFKSMSMKENIRSIAKDIREEIVNYTYTYYTVFGLDTQMVDTVVNELNNPWRVVLADSIFARRHGVVVEMGVVMPEWLLPIYTQYAASIVQPSSSISHSPQYAETHVRYISFARRRGFLPRHSDPRFGDTAGILMFSAGALNLPILIARFPMSNLISVYACMAILQPSIETTLPPADLFSTIGVSINRGSVIRDMITMQITSQEKADMQNILLAILNPTQVLLNFDLDIEDINIKMRIIAVCLCKALFICSPTFTNLSQNTAHALDDYLMANVHAYGVSQEVGTATGLMQSGRRVQGSLDLATHFDLGRGWLNSTYASGAIYVEPLYNGVTHYPVYGSPREPLPAGGVIRQEDCVGAVPRIWNVIMQVFGGIRLMINESVHTFLSAYQDAYVHYLLRLNTFMFRNYEHGLRLPYNATVAILNNNNTMCGPPLNFTVSLKSVIHFFLNMPSQFDSNGMGIKQIALEHDYSQQLSILIEHMTQARDLIQRLNYQELVSMRDSLRAVSGSASGGLTKVIKTCSELMLTSFFDGYAEIVQLPHPTPYSTALRALYLAFHQYPEWFGATNKVTYALRPYELPARDRATRIARGVVLTNASVGPSRRMPFEEWRVHLQRGELLHTLYQAREHIPSITMGWFIPYELHVSPVMPKLPAPFTVMPDPINSARSSIKFGSFTEFHTTNVDVEASIDTWLVNDMVHKFMIIHDAGLVRQVPTAGVNHMVRRVNTTSHGAVDIISLSDWFEKLFTGFTDSST